jgi:hypothetical protein
MNVTLSSSTQSSFAELILMEIDGIRELDPKFYKDGIVDRDRVGVQFLAIYQR